MTNINKENITILKKFNKTKSGRLLGGTSRDIADKYGLTTITPRTPLKTVPDTAYILNWGNTHEPSWLQQYLSKKGFIINHPSKVGEAVHKNITLDILSTYGIPCVEHTSSCEESEQWILEGSKVFCRTLTRASKGKGIVIATTLDELVEAPLYTKNYDKNREYRIHVFDKEVIDIQIKRRRTKDHLEELGLEVNPDIRNMRGGYVFCRSNCRRDKAMENAAIDAVSLLGLTFGAVDVLGKVDSDGSLISFVICEVNTAPALEGTTFDSYMKALDNFTDKQAKLNNKFIDMVVNS